MNEEKEQRKLDGKLIEACYNNHPEIVKELLKNGADINATEESSYLTMTFRTCGIERGFALLILHVDVCSVFKKEFYNFHMGYC
jgi:ankyrin repeat protein